MKKKQNTKKKNDGQELKICDTAEDKSIVYFVRHYVHEIKIDKGII